MKQFYKIISFLFILGLAIQAKAQVLEANDDNIKTGPSQKIRYDVTKNDVIPCRTYTLELVTSVPAATGTASFDGDFLVFTPAPGVASTTVSIVYKLTCAGGDSKQATVTVTVLDTNLPINIIQTGEACIDTMPKNVRFGVESKYIAKTSPTDGFLQMFHIPLVGDLNGDGKPEIISPRMSAKALATKNTHICIFDGQTGIEILEFDLSTLGTGYGSFQLGSLPYHQSPSYLAIADVDNDGIGEIIVCQSTYEGKVYALKPVLGANKKITTLTKVWDAECGHKAPLSPTGTLTYQIYGQPIPNIVDINGDGIPELVVYNKIYNAQTGKLLMAWNGTATSATASSLAAGTGLDTYNPGTAASVYSNNVSKNETMSNTVKSRAMVGRRPAGTVTDVNFAEPYIAVPAIVDVDRDGIMEIVTGARIHKFNLTYLGKNGEPGSHTQNTYTTFDGPTSATVPVNTDGTSFHTYYFNDGFTRVADLDGDGKLEAIVFQNATGGGLDLNILAYVWDLETGALQAVSSFYTDGTHGTFGIPFVGDINDRLDGRSVIGGSTYDKKLPEVCLITGRVYLNRTTDNYGGRTGLAYHPKSDMSDARIGYNMILGMTYDGGETNVENRLKVSWVLEHEDYSTNTGITMFDFNNDGAFDLCYRDERTLRVISPKLGTTDYIRYNHVPVGEAGTTNPGILFKTTVYSETGYEAPAIADVNMDGSADIIVAGYNTTGYQANVYVFERKTGSSMWAPCPPVWNQALYNPLHINEDLTVPAKPISMLTPFLNGDGETIYPYNGAWIQQPIVKEGDPYVPVYRYPDAVLTNLIVDKVGASQTKVAVTIRNDGLASINANTPVYIYMTPDLTTKSNAVVKTVGVDIFPNEKVTVEYTINGDPAGMFIHCRIIDDGINYLATGFFDCDTTNNYGYTSLIKAVDDYVSAFKEVETTYDIVANDTIIGIAKPEIYEGPRHGTATIGADGKLSYTSNSSVPTADTIVYILKCEYNGTILASVDTAYVYIRILERPDNIIDAECVVQAPSSPWGTPALQKIGSDVVDYAQVYAGDLDGDGLPELVTLGGHYGDYGTGIAWGGKHINIYMGNNRADVRVITRAIAAQVGSIALGKVLLDDASYKSLIFVVGTDAYLYAYSLDDLVNPFWKSDNLFTDINTVLKNQTIGLADFNQDGFTEIYIGHSIFDAATGKLLCRANTPNEGISNMHSNRQASVTTVADINNDGILELLVGNTAWTITPNRAIPSLSTATSFYQAPTPVAGIEDGHTQVVDLDLDGYVDVVVSRVLGTKIYIYVWSYKKQAVIAHTSFTAPKENAGHTEGGKGFPFIGDINGDGYPEIIVLGDKIRAFRYDGTTTLSQYWELAHSDTSYGTGMTLFDFNQDGAQEIVYRGISNLMIIDGRGYNNPQILFQDLTCKSSTLSEYPIIVDIDNDGQAEIIVSSGNYTAGSLFVYEAPTGMTWAPARKVWNQYGYNAVNINEDLTIPKIQLSPATVLPGDGITGEIRPYNGFLQQQTMLNKWGNPLWIAPNGQIVGEPVFKYDAATDSMLITVKVANVGDAAFQNPFYITVYKNGIGGTPSFTHKYEGIIMPDSTASITFNINDFKADWYPFDSVLIRINDIGDGYNHQVVCDSANRDARSLIVIANNDYVSTFLPVDIDVLANDIYIATCGTISPVIITGPQNGTATIIGDKIQYTPGGVIGLDSVKYSISCNGKADTAMVYIVVNSKPDNIIAPDNCFISAPSFDFNIKQKWVTASGTAHRMSSTIIGDLDGDGVAEIAVYGNVDNGNNNINIFDGSSKILKAQIAIPTIHQGAGWRPAMIATMVDADRNGLGEIIVTRSDLKIMSYEADTTGGTFTMIQKWPVFSTYVSPTGDKLPHPNIADLNNDGIPELIVFNQIYNAVTGEYLGETEPIASAYVGRIPLHHGNKASNFQSVADIDNDGIMEIIAGGKIYKPIFNATKTAVTFEIAYNNTNIPDGFTSVADVDMDGKLDVVVATSSSSTATHLYVWSPLDNRMIDDFQIAAAGGYNGVSFPFIGDIDGETDGLTGKKYPEICVNSVYKVFAYKYNSATGKYGTKWVLATSDESGATGITLFDFNNDGISELVYRDQSSIRILDGSGAAPVLASPGASFSCGSSTSFEYPSIADVDGDGSANICVTCNPYLIVFESAVNPWAPTRKVWNQVNYDPTLINDDLTVPMYPISKNMELNGSHPYNGALIQVPTMVGGNFDIVMQAANPSAEAMWTEQLNPATVRVWVRIKNKGVKNTNASLPVALYGVNPPPVPVDGSHIAIKEVGVVIAPNETYDMYFDIPIASLTPAMSIRIQDDGIKYPADGSYLDCDYSNNFIGLGVLMAVADHSVVDYNDSEIIDVLANDQYGGCTRGSLAEFDTISNSGLHLGSLIINGDSTFTYTPDLNAYGVDSLDYYIKCGSDSSAARVYILVHKPLSQQYNACPGVSVQMGFTSIAGVQYNWYNAQTGGAIVTGGTNTNTLTITKGDAADIGTWWVEPVWNGITFPRYQVDLLLAANCGNSNPTDCAVDGTVLFREDFGGNDETLPDMSPIALFAGVTGYTFTTSYHPSDGQYSINKGLANLASTWLRFTDHTHTGDYEKGYLMLVNASHSPQIFYTDTITDLCPDMELYFSTWVGNLVRTSSPSFLNPKLRFVLEDAVTGTVLAVFNTGDIAKDGDADGVWKHYGFNFTTSTSSSICFKIYNDEIGGNGNDLVLDDIEVRLCAPAVHITTPAKLDTMVCANSLFVLNGTYAEGTPETFGNNLTYRWEYSTTGDINTPSDWSVISGTVGTSSDGTVNSTYTISSTTISDEGYYRLVVGKPSLINQPNCRASSEVIHLGIYNSPMAYPDIRVQICPNMGEINLTSYLDTVDFKSITWSPLSLLMPAISATGKVNSNNMTALSTYGYEYKLKNSCYEPTGKLYVTTLFNTALELPPDTIVICCKQAEAMQLNRILGVDLGGTWVYDNTVNPDNTVANNINVIVAPSVHAGAYIFNAYKAWQDAGSAYLIPGGYNGDLTAKMFKVRYTTPASSCVGAASKDIVVIVTQNL